MIILASNSPRRKELLKQIFPDFKVIPANINEDDYPLEQLSYYKGNKIAEDYPQDLIIAADTFVELNGRIFNKPKDKLEAEEMLNTLSNKTHRVITYYTLIKKDQNICFTGRSTTLVTFNKLSKRLINNYIKTGSPLDKAGAYGIQDNDKFPLIKNYQGSLNNVIGLPIEELKEVINNLGIQI